MRLIFLTLHDCGRRPAAELSPSRRRRSTWIGVQSGKSAANTLLDKSGRREAIDAATARGIERAADELTKTMGSKVEVRGSATGGRMVSPAGVRGSNDESLGRNESGEGVAYEEPGRELTQESMSDGVGYSDRGASSLL